MKTPAFRFFFAAAISLCALAPARATLLTVNVTADSYFRGDSPNTNYGSNAELLVGDLKDTTPPINSNLRLILAVSLTDPALMTAAQQPGFDVLNATLRLTASSVDSTSSDNVETLQLFQLDESFDASQVTWNNRSSGVPWTTGGGTFDGSPLATLDANPTAVTAGQELDFTSGDLADLTQTAVGSTLYFIVKIQNEDDLARSLFRMASAEATGQSGPQFIIEYATIPEPGACALLLGSVGLLIGVRRLRRPRA